MLFALVISTDTIAALATPQGTGAISVIRLSGKSAIGICNSVFRGKSLEKQPSHTIHYGHIVDADSIIDEVMVAIFRAPKSFTTEDVVEISCHGSPFIAEQVLQLLIKNGARAAKPGEFTLRAFMHGRIDLTQAEAVADLIASDSAASHDVALKQMRGGFATDLKNLRQQLIDYAALIELELDFGEEDVEFANRQKLIDLISQLTTHNSQLIESFKVGNVIKNGVNTVIAGRPNAGKSTLLNKLLNEERAIVSDIPGTTRDTIEEVISINGVQFRFIDTAGIRQTDDVIEKQGVEKTLEKLKQSAVFIYLFDVNTLTPEELLLDINELNLLGFKGILVGNKIDQAGWKTTAPFYHILETSLNKEENIATNLELLFLSANTGFNVNLLRQKLYDITLGSQLATHNSQLITNLRHYEALVKANESLDKAKIGLEQKLSGELVAFDLRDALEHLGSITGEVSNEEILGSIFSRFCIGK
ncbi:MAG: tRNA uridine-5-carboxymethylaminomethyl(34) synthesis GTPase MnmE [Chitinophagales bacterium]|nr:tRNA uridine-5-carboxymethylaminomethyl(34) synthesis GTPase MnmE [Chitinophagales bacterium]